MIGLNDSKEEKQKTTTTRLSFVLLTSAVLVLSSIAAVQFLSTNNNAVFAALRCSEEPPTSEGTVDSQCSGGIPLTNAEGGTVGGFGGHTACTTDISDISTDISTCTASGGNGNKFRENVGGGRSICTGDFSPDDDPETEEEPITCSFEAGSSTKPLPDEEGG